MLIGFATDKGKSRASNQDAGYASAENRLLAVADGLGGHSGGAEASNIAVSSLMASASDTKIDLPGLGAMLEEANRKIIKVAAEVPELSGMGTTMTVAFIREGRALIGHVGDSRAYLIREGEARRLTSDHSLAGQLLSSGVLKAEDVSGHPGRHAVIKCLGACDKLEPELIEMALRPDDVLVLCTDGFWDQINDLEIAERFSQTSDMMTVCEDMTRLANIRGGGDNITVVAALLEESDVR